MRIAMPRGIWLRRMSLDGTREDVPNVRRFANWDALSVVMIGADLH
jgi:hypothetical protein